MRYFVFLLFYVIVQSACSNRAIVTSPRAPQNDQATAKAPRASVSVTPDKHFSPLVGRDIPLQTHYIDTVQFVERNDQGDYYLFSIKKEGNIHALVYDLVADEDLDFLRGDILEITYQLDSIWIAGDGETLDYTEWLTAVRKLDDSAIASLRKKFTKPLSYWYAEEESYSEEFESYLYTLVEYYIAKSEQPLIKYLVEDIENTAFVYSIESTKKDGRHYTVLGLANDMGEHATIVQWLYLDTETRILYEYDLAKDKLIEFTR